MLNISHLPQGLFRIAAAALLAVAPMAASAELPMPEGAVVLTVTGGIEIANAEGAAQFDLAMLEAMPATEFTTETIWTQGAQTFRGVELKELLDRLGATGETLTAVALNDYAVEMPVSDAVEGGPMIAYHLNGEPMPRREKGPLWIVYPYDLDERFRNEMSYSRSVWQLKQIEVE